MEELRQTLAEAAKKLFKAEVQAELSRPDEKFGDFSSNIALQLAPKLGKNPVEIAQKIAEELKPNPLVKEIDVAKPGFINIRISDEVLAKEIISLPGLDKSMAAKQILVEFGDPNPFKEMHIGHLYSYIVGDSIASILENAGADVKRLSYHGDVGLHVAKAIWGMKTGHKKVGEAYAAGAKAYDDESSKKEIDVINEHIYKKDDPEINKLYEQGRKTSFESFDTTLSKLGIKTDQRYLESESAPVGQEYVEKNIGKVFKKSQGAVVYDGEKDGLHTRVFLTSQGLPTYESKDLGLAQLKNRDYPKTDRSIVITAHEQAEYFKVMLAALKKIESELANKTTHLTHGFLSLSTGKMSSRSGDVFAADELLKNVKNEVKKQYPDSLVTEEVYLAAIKYSFLKHRLGQDIVVDVKEAVSLDGNSGPYLQYAHARARSILSKAKGSEPKIDMFDNDERSLVLKILEYKEAVNKSTEELMPHHIANYLYELAQTFNRFYEKNRIIGDSREAVRLELVKAYSNVLKNGLGLLNIQAPTKM